MECGIWLQAHCGASVLLHASPSKQPAAADPPAPGPEIFSAARERPIQRHLHRHPLVVGQLVALIAQRGNAHAQPAQQRPVQLSAHEGHPEPAVRRVVQRDRGGGGEGVGKPCRSWWGARSGQRKQKVMLRRAPRECFCSPLDSQGSGGHHALAAWGSRELSQPPLSCPCLQWVGQPRGRKHAMGGSAGRSTT